MAFIYSRKMYFYSIHKIVDQPYTNGPFSAFFQNYSSHMQADLEGEKGLFSLNKQENIFFSIYNEADSVLITLLRFNHHRR